MRRARLLAALLAVLPGCDETWTAGGVATVTPMFAVVTARDLRGLKHNESLEVALDGPFPTVFEFDGRGGELAFDRIDIIAPGAEPVSMNLWLARQANNYDLDFAELPSARFRLANDAMAAALGLPTQDISGADDCTPVEVVEVDRLVAVLFVDDESC